MKCKCNDRAHDLVTGLWHRSYCNWYDHDRAGHRIRAAVWGWVADLACRLGDNAFLAFRGGVHRGPRA